MIGAFARVTLQSLRNRVVHRIRMLKQPRYLIGGILGLLWFANLMLRNRAPVRINHLTENSAILLDLVSLPVLAILLLTWYVPTSALAYTAGEAQFLFTAPLTRRQLLLYKLVRSQLNVIITTLVMTFFRFPHGRYLGLWACVTTIGIYIIFVELARAKLRAIGVSTMWQIIGVSVIVTAVANIFVAFAHKPVANGTPFDSAILRVILFVPGLFAHAAVARSWLELASYVVIVLAIGALLFLIGSSLRIPLEEIALDASERQLARTERKQQRRSGMTIRARNMRPLFQLKEGSSPEVAIFWKNLIGVMRVSFPLIALFLTAFALLFVFGLFIAQERPAIVFCAGLSACITCLFLIAGASIVPFDLRHEARRLDILKSWPIAGDRLIAASIAAPLVIVAFFQLLFLTNTALIVARLHEREVHIPPELLVILFLFAVPICVAQLLLRNAMMIFFPAWVVRSKEEQRGFVAIGQRLLALLMNLVVFCAVLVPAAIVSGIGFWIGMQFAGGQPALLAAMTAPGVAVLLLEVWLGLRFLGAQFDRLDVANEGGLVGV
ncbi:MAG TPA: putative ABC exporter domain-containing protein [Thermoanaerobaculia bacterium]|nr:putative ABC exporter domain-containing protein [Thermoanaerobaculia bacterium]